MEALKRELSEEIEDNFELSISKFDFVSKFMVECDKRYEFNLYELVLNDEKLQQLQSAKILEGYGVLVSLEELKRGRWIWCLEQVIAQYLEILLSK